MKDTMLETMFTLGALICVIAAGTAAGFILVWLV